MAIRHRVFVFTCGLVIGGYSSFDSSSMAGSTARSTVPAARAGAGTIAVNRFNIVYRLDGDMLNVALDTDLPDFAEVIASVSRSYFEKGSADELSRDYFRESSTVGQWRQSHRIEVSHAMFQRRLEEKRKELASLGLGAPIARISDNISVSFVLHQGQSHKAFGTANAGLNGKAVVALGKGKIVRAEIEVPYPIRKGAGETPHWVTARDLVQGRTYELPSETPLMPELAPRGVDETLDAIAARRVIPAGGTLTVKLLADRNGVRWYRVTAVDASGRPVGEGWVNSSALIGKPLRQK